jgi:hypothetical protein
MPEKRRKCPHKRSIDNHAKKAKKALQELRKIVKADKKLKMRLDAAKDHLKAIEEDHHLL